MAGTNGNTSFSTHEFPSQYEPSSLEGDHKNDGSGKGFEWMDSGVTHHNSPPTITHGDKTSWSTYGRYSHGSSKSGTGWYNKDATKGSVKTNWGVTGSKHTSIISVGGNQGLWLACGTSYEQTGVGFEMRRTRTDSSSNNNNAKQHCIFLRRWGVEFVQRNGSSTKFWSSNTLNTDGNFNGGTASGSTITQYYFYQHYWKQGFSADYNWVVKRLWFNLATKDGSYTSDATTDVYIYNCRAYHDMHAGSNGKNRWWKPAWRSLSDRGKVILK